MSISLKELKKNRLTPTERWVLETIEGVKPKTNPTEIILLSGIKMVNWYSHRILQMWICMLVMILFQFCVTNLVLKMVKY